MKTLFWLGVALTGLILLALTIEKLQALRYRRALCHIIHVNGTRGKSSVVRLIDAALRHNGIKVMSKSTGTVPMILHVDGSETELKRHAPANIREQLGLLRMAAKEGAQVLVIECMAVDPRLQYAAQHQILQADIGVLTNARLDHQDVMGDTREEVLEALLNTVPCKGVILTAEQDFFPRIKAFAEKLKSRAHLALPQEEELQQTLDFPDNIALAAAVAEELGIPREKALEAMAKVRRDPYSMEILQRGKLCFVNAMSTNDVESAKLVLQRALDSGAEGKQLAILINNRADRPARAREMVRLCRELSPQRIWLLGDQPAALKRLCRRAVPGIPVEYEPDLNRLLQPEEPTLLLAVGNIKGDGMRLMELLHREGEQDV